MTNSVDIDQPTSEDMDPHYFQRKVIVGLESEKSVCFMLLFENTVKVSKGAKIRNRYNQVPHLTQDTNGKGTNSQLDTTNESQKVSPFPAGDHSIHKTEKT